MIAKRLAAVLTSFVALSCASQSSPPPPAPLPPPPSAAPSAPAAPPVAQLPPVDPKPIDAAIRAEWAKASITPTGRVDDARFLRRAYVDIVGVIPPEPAVTEFLADRSRDKRAKLVDQLVASPAYAEYWAAYWDDALIGRVQREPTVDRAAFRAWLQDQFAKNTPWNALVYALMTATGQNGGGDGDGTAPNAAAINGAVNWTLKYSATPQDLAGAAAKTFLGVQIQCAQCHDHKTEKWKQADFQKFANCFTRTKLVILDKGPAMGKTKRVEVHDLDRPAPRFNKNDDVKEILVATPAPLDGPDLSSSKNVREAIAAWFTDAKNPWFAQAIVNRMWGHMVGRGFVDPVDDIRPSNPATMQPLLDQLAADFVAHGYDLRYLVREIAATQVYQLSSEVPITWKPGEKADLERKLWARFRIAPLGPEELIASVLRATDLEEAVRKNPKLDMDAIRQKLARAYSFIFDVDEEVDHDSFEGTITQALTLLNGAFVGGGSSDLPGGALAQVLAGPGDDAAKTRHIYLRTLSRPPSADEAAYWQKYLTDAQSAPAAAPVPKPKGGPLEKLESRGAGQPKSARVQAFEDMFWTLLNSSEFVFNH